LSEAANPTLERRNLKVALMGLAFAGFMIGLAYAAVPFYRWFCQVTGWGGTTMLASTIPTQDQISERVIGVRFSASTGRDMPWEFAAVKPRTDLKIGEQGLAFYEAYNPTDRPITGTSTFNVVPQQAGKYFMKIECFCFKEQTLQPGQRVQMPVAYFIDPEALNDPDMANVREITLNYTFFPVAGTGDPNGTFEGRKFDVPQAGGSLRSAGG
jgi:cytochrome c oxidase assembly protein subunit 11